MAKYATGLIKETEKQTKLKEKYDVSQDVKVVEKSGALNAFVKIVQIVAGIASVVLSSIGLMAIIYPQTRTLILQIFKGAVRELWFLIT